VVKWKKVKGVLDVANEKFLPSRSRSSHLEDSRRLLVPNGHVVAGTIPKRTRLSASRR